MLKKIKINGIKVHSTQKPKTYYRSDSLSTEINDVILDPFLGSAATAAVAKKFREIGLALKKEKIHCRSRKVKAIKAISTEDLEIIKSKKMSQKFIGTLLEKGIINPGKLLFDGRQRWFAKLGLMGLISTKRVLFILLVHMFRV